MGSHFSPKVQQQPYNCRRQKGVMKQGPTDFRRCHNILVPGRSVARDLCTPAGDLCFLSDHISLITPHASIFLLG
jgi:hypothetical protein